MSEPVRMWLDDERDPVDYGRAGWVWAKTYEEAVELLASGRVIEASLDHDLGLRPDGSEKSGYDVVLYMEEHGIWPRNGVHVHSMNPVGRERMRRALRSIQSRTAIRPR